MEARVYSETLQKHFAANANAWNAGRMSKYMLNQFDYFGIQSPLRKKLAAEFIAAYGLPAPEQLDETVKLVWQMPQRELHYVIMEICSRKIFLADDNRIELYKFMITGNSWWDTVDYIAANLVGAWLTGHKNQTIAVTTGFMESGNLWLWRTALLFQLKYRKSADFGLLSRFIEELSGSNEFFIRKAIGWALREYSKSNPQAVLEFVSGHQLSALSKKEALRIIIKNRDK